MCRVKDYVLPRPIYHSSDLPEWPQTAKYSTWVPTAAHMPLASWDPITVTEKQRMKQPSWQSSNWNQGASRPAAPIQRVITDSISAIKTNSSNSHCQFQRLRMRFFNWSNKNIIAQEDALGSTGHNSTASDSYQWPSRLIIIQEGISCYRLCWL